MLEPLRRLRKEIDAVSLAIRAAHARLPPDDTLIDRLYELVYNWSTNIQPGLSAIGIPPEVINRADAAFLSLARLTGRNSQRSKLLSALSRARRTLIEQVLLEVAKAPKVLQITTTNPVPKVLIPEIPDLPNELIPNALHGWLPQIRDFLKRNSFDRNVFIMVAYRKDLRPMITRLKKVLVRLKLNPVVAKDHALTDDLYNPIACLLCCNYGIAIFDEPEIQQIHNPNVVYELGMMQLLKRPCVILKHKSLKKMPSDLLNKLYEDYEEMDEAARKVDQWWERQTKK